MQWLADGRNHVRYCTQTISKMLHRRTFFRQRPATIADRCHSNVGKVTVQVTIYILPLDDALLEGFDFFLHSNVCIDVWHPLVHVCQKW